MTGQKRERSVAHLWADKRVMRFFRQNFERKEYKKLRNVYLALCEIDSDFTEERESSDKTIHSLTKTCSTYTGMDLNNVSEILQVLKAVGLIDYGRKMDGNNRVIGSYLVMHMWEGEMRETLIRKNPNKEKPLYIKNILKNRSLKNNSKELGKDNPLRKGLSNGPMGQSDTPIPLKRRKSLDISIGGRNNRPTRESVTGPRRHGKYLPYGDASEGGCRLVNYWNGLKNTVTHRLDSKAVERVLWWLDNETDRGKDFGPIMDVFDAMLSDPQTYEVPRRKVGLDEFFFGNDFVRNGKRSWCSKLIFPGGHKQFLREEDRNPEITRELRDQYEKGVLVESPDYGPKQEADFVKGASMLERYARGKRLERYIDNPGMDDYVDYMLQALADEFGASEITTGHLRSDYTYNSVLPRFLSRHFEE